jgi:superfamily II DNA or RNA helicase
MVRSSFARQPYLKRGEGPIVLVLAPTRELAVQIKEECDKFGASSQIKNTVVYGGVKKHTQVAALQSGVEIVIVSKSGRESPIRGTSTSFYCSFRTRTTAGNSWATH